MEIVMKKQGNLPHELYQNRLHALSRFFFIRQTCSIFQTIRQKLLEAIGVKPSFKPSDTNKVSMFENTIEATAIVEQVRQNSVACGLSLQRQMTAEILHYAQNANCYEPGFFSGHDSSSLQTFQIDELQNDDRRFGSYKPSRALVLLPGGGEHASDCPAIETLVRDPVLLKIAQHYLGYWPNRITRHLTFILPRSPDRETPPAADWHLDIAGWRPFTFYTYITAVQDKFSGPHLFIQGSHRSKPLPLVLSSSRHQEHKLFQFYPMEDKQMVLGESGFSFWEDPSCWHRVELPIHTNRLILQLRYS